jgi:uncharacterized protein
VSGASKCDLPSGKGDSDVIGAILGMKTIAVVGCSPKPERPGHYVAEYMKDHGYKIIPVNPGQKDILGETCYPDLSSVPGPIDVVDVFRNPAFVRPVIEEAIKVKAKALWLQDGITDPEGEAMARKAGLLVVSNDCMLRQHSRRSR